MKNSSLFTILILSFSLVLTAQNTQILGGTYKFGENIEKESVGIIDLVPNTKNTFFIHLNVSKAAPSYSTSFLLSKITITNNTAEYVSETNKGCHLKFVFSNNKVTISDVSTKTWGSAAVGKTYQKTNYKIPRYFYFANGDQIKFSEESQLYSMNHFNTTDTYRWGEGLCDYYGVYKTADFNATQLEQAFEIADPYATDRQNVFSSWYNLKHKNEVEERITFFYNRYKNLKKTIKTLKNIPVNNSILWDVYISENIKVIDELYPIHQLLLRAYYNPKLLIQSEYYPLIKNAANILNSTDVAIKRYYNKITKDDAEKVSNVELMRKHIYSQKIENVLLDTVTTRYLLFQKLFISTQEECHDGPN